MKDSDKKIQLKKFPKALQNEIKNTVRCKDYTEESLAKLQISIGAIIESKLKPGERTDLSSDKHLSQVEDTHKTLKTIADIFNESRETVRKRLVILTKSKLDSKYLQLMHDIDNPSKKQTINSVFKEIIKEKKKKLKLKELNKIQIKLPKNIKLFNTSFEKVKIKDESVSLIITDPDYSSYNVQVYADLAKQSMRVLKPGGSLLCFAGHYILPEIMAAVKQEGMNFHWQLIVLHSGPTSLMFSKRIMVAYKPLLWFTKGKYDGEHVKDVVQSKQPDKDLHPWAQSTVEAEYYIKYLTKSKEIVYDPFMGSGTNGIAAVNLGRQFIGSEIDKKHFKTASKLITLGLKKSGKNKIV